MEDECPTVCLGDELQDCDDRSGTFVDHLDVAVAQELGRTGGGVEALQLPRGGDDREVVQVGVVDAERRAAPFDSRPVEDVTGR